MSEKQQHEVRISKGGFAMVGGHIAAYVVDSEIDRVRSRPVRVMDVPILDYLELTYLESKEVPPDQGGCWFCHKSEGLMQFTMEFDAYFHMDCLKHALLHSDETHSDEEAEIIAREFRIRLE